MPVIAVPAELYSDLDPERRCQRLLRVDLKEQRRRAEFDFEVLAIFERYVLARRPGLPQSAYCLATKGGEMEVSFGHAECIQHTPARTIAMDIEIENGTHNKDSDAINSKVTAKLGVSTSNIGSVITGERAKVSSSKAIFKVEEPVLHKRFFRNGVGWIVGKPPNPQASLHYIWETVVLNARFRSSRLEFDGQIKMRPAGLSLFGSDGKEKSPKLLVISLLLARARGQGNLRQLTETSTLKLLRREKVP